MVERTDQADTDHEGRESRFMDIDRMVNEGLGGGQVTEHNGLIEETTTDTMGKAESVIEGGQTNECRSHTDDLASSGND